jgi:plastocyanin
LSEIEEVQVQEGRARWTKLAVLGLVMAALGPILMLTAGLIWGLEDFGEALAFFGPVALIALIAAGLAWRFELGGRIAGIVGGVLVAGALFWTAFGLFSPGSFFDFVPGLLVLPGGLIAVGASIGAIVAARRGHLTAEPTGRERAALRFVPAVVVVLAALSGVVTLTGQSSVDESEADLVVRFKDFEYDQESYEVAAGSTVLVRNDDPFQHTFTIEALDVDENVTPGSEKLIEIPAEPGDYIVFCRPHTSDPDDPDVEDDMFARITIE